MKNLFYIALQGWSLIEDTIFDISRAKKILLQLQELDLSVYDDDFKALIAYGIQQIEMDKLDNETYRADFKLILEKSLILGFDEFLLNSNIFREDDKVRRKIDSLEKTIRLMRDKTNGG